MSAVRWIRATVVAVAMAATIFGIGAGTSAGHSVVRADGSATCPTAMGWEGTSCQ